MSDVYSFIVSVEHEFSVTINAQSVEDAELYARRVGLALVSVRELPDRIQHLSTAAHAKLAPRGADLQSIP